MTHIDPDRSYRTHNAAKLQSALDRHTMRTHFMLAGAMLASLAIVSAAAAVVLVML